MRLERAGNNMVKDSVSMSYEDADSFLRWLKTAQEPDQSAFISDLDKAKRDGLLEYSDNREWDGLGEERAWHVYWYRHGRKPRDDSTAFYFAEQVKRLTHILCGNATCKTVLDFGACCAVPDQIIADYFPEVKVIGLDRSERTRRLNEQTFSAPNLTFAADDIFHFIKSTNLHGAALVHARTTCLLYPAAVDMLYREAANAGIKHILALEYTGYSRELKQFYDFSSESESRVLRDGMYAHNYLSLLERNGYVIVSAELKKVPMRKPQQQDMHAVIVHAQLRT